MSLLAQSLPQGLRRLLRGPYWWVRNRARLLLYRTLPQSIRGNWQAALPDEVVFWDRFLADKGGAAADEYIARTAEGAPVEPLLAERLVGTDKESLAILDVGSGPLPAVGRSLTGHTVRVVGVDPLATEYSLLLQRHGVAHPAELVAGEAEGLDELFGAAEFDAVFSSNAIDHCHDPVRALRQMLRVCRTGGTVFLRHFENEGRKRAYRELHQWNLCEKAGSLIIWSPGRRHDVSKLLEGEVDLEVRTSEDERGRRVVVAILTKLASPDLNSPALAPHGADSPV